MKAETSRLLGLISMMALLITMCTSSDSKGQAPLKTGPIQTQTVSVPLPPDPSKPVDLTLQPEAAQMTMGTETARLVEGTIQYNVQELQPAINISGSKVTITQSPLKGALPQDAINKWNLRLNHTVPINLVVQAEACDGAWNLGGLRLQSLKWEEQASRLMVAFDWPNPDKIESLNFKAVASTLKLTGLANLNFAQMGFEGNAGTYTLDFSGKLRRNANVELKTTASTTTIIVPVGTSVRITLKSQVSTIKTVGAWTTSGATYTTGKEEATDKLSIHADVGTCQLVLDTH